MACHRMLLFAMLLLRLELGSTLCTNHIRRATQQRSRPLWPPCRGAKGCVRMSDVPPPPGYLPNAPPIKPPPAPLPRYSWRTVFFFVANPLVMLPFAAIGTWLAPGLGFSTMLGTAFQVSASATKTGALIAAPMLMLSLLADELIPALKEVTQASRVITLYAFGARLLPLRAALGSVLVSTSAAVAEEVAFRGTLQAGVTALALQIPGVPPALAAALAVFAQAIVFGRLHTYTDNAIYAIAAAVAGAVFGLAFALTANLWVPIVTHFVVDLVGFLVCHLQVTRLPEAEQAALLALDLPIANALRLTFGGSAPPTRVTTPRDAM